MKNPAAGRPDCLMCVVEKRYDDNKPGWEYKLKDTRDELYQPWVSEKELTEAS